MLARAAAHTSRVEMSLFVSSFPSKGFAVGFIGFVYLWSADTGQRHALPTGESFPWIRNVASIAVFFLLEHWVGW